MTRILLVVPSLLAGAALAGVVGPPDFAGAEAVAPTPSSSAGPGV